MNRGIQTGTGESSLRAASARLTVAQSVGAPPPPDAARLFVEEFLRLPAPRWMSSSPSSVIVQEEDPLLSAVCFLGDPSLALPAPADRAIDALRKASEQLGGTAEHAIAGGDYHARLRQARSSLAVVMDSVVGGVGAASGVPFLLEFRGLVRRLYRRPSNERGVAVVNGETISAEHAQQSLVRVLDVLDDAIRRWFDPALLAVQRVAFASAPAYELNAIRDADRVHPVNDVTALRHRFEDGKACFALYHRLWRPGSESLAPVRVRGDAQPAFVLSGGRGLPLANVMAAFATTVPASMTDIEACRGAAERDGHVVCFYSINSMHEGIAGLRLGQLLINRALQLCVRESDRDVKRGDRQSALSTFVTLSPLPGFSKWLEELLVNGGGLEFGLLQHDTARTFCDQFLPKSAVPTDGEVRTAAARILHNTLFGKTRWFEDASLTQVFRAPLMELAEEYIVRAGKSSKRAIDPVANFHIGNGAVLYRLNWMADPAPLRLQQSFGIMANYMYDTSAPVLEQHALAYMQEGVVQRAKL